MYLYKSMVLRRCYFQNKLKRCMIYIYVYMVASILTSQVHRYVAEERTGFEQFCLLFKIRK